MRNTHIFIFALLIKSLMRKRKAFLSYQLFISMLGILIQRMKIPHFFYFLFLNIKFSLCVNYTTENLLVPSLMVQRIIIRCLTIAVLC